MDVWGDSDEEEEAKPAERDERQLRQKHYNEGYKESLKEAREAALQGGFGKGFTEGFAHGLRAGRIIGISSTVVDMDSGLSQSSDGEQMKQVLQEAKALTKAKAVSNEDYVTKLNLLDAKLAPLLAPSFHCVLRGNS